MMKISRKTKKFTRVKRIVAVAYGIIITVNNISTATTSFSRKKNSKKEYKHTYPLLALSSHDDTMVLLAISLKKFHVKKKVIVFTEKIANDNSRFLYSLLLICFVVVLD